MPISMNNTTLTFNNGTTMTTAATGTVTSVATGNGLAGGTITGSGTLTLACPSGNTIGSTILGNLNYPSNSVAAVYGSNYSIGTGNGQISHYNASTAGITGTWKYLGPSVSTPGETGVVQGICCKVA